MLSWLSLSSLDVLILSFSKKNVFMLGACALWEATVRVRFFGDGSMPIIEVSRNIPTNTSVGSSPELWSFDPQPYHMCTNDHHKRTNIHNHNTYISGRFFPIILSYPGLCEEQFMFIVSRFVAQTAQCSTSIQAASLLQWLVTMLGTWG